MTRLLVVAGILGLAGQAFRVVARPANVSLVQRSAYLMGTRADLSAWAASRTEGLARLDRALAALEETERALSTWRDTSQLASLNRAALQTPWQADPALCALLATVVDWDRASSGAFDPAIGSLIDAWALRGAGRVPSDAELAQARAASGLRNFALDRARCTVQRRGPAIMDEGAFGKGEALDRAAPHLAGVAWTINLGGQVSVGGRPPGRDAWTVAVADPTDRHHVFLTVRLEAGSLATSGGSERDLVADGRRIGHILDPRTGRPAEFQGSVTVWHERGLAADILSTTLYVLGPDEGLAWAEARGVAACFLEVDLDGRVQTSMTKAFRRLLG